MSKSPLHVVQAPAQYSMNLGARLRSLREARGWSQEAAAVRAGMTRNTLARHESTQLPDLKLSTMLALMELYGVHSLDALIGQTPVQQLLQVWIDEGRPGLRGEVVG
jgi:transcriptional regulator with XRE-family HTH domain